MGKVKLTLVFVLVLVFAAFTPGGCNEDQLHQADQTMADVNAMGTIARDIAQSPAGQAIPPPIRFIMELLGISAVAAYGIWQRSRRNGLSTTLRAIADGVDTAPTEASDQVKQRIKQVMDIRQIRSLADPIVDAHRSIIKS